MIRFGRRCTSALGALLVASFLVPPQAYADDTQPNGPAAPANAPAPPATPAQPPAVAKVDLAHMPSEVRAAFGQVMVATMDAQVAQLRTPAARAQIEARIAQGEANLATHPDAATNSQLLADRMLLEVAKGNSVADTQRATSALMAAEVAKQGLNGAAGEAFASDIGNRMAATTGAVTPNVIVVDHRGLGGDGLPPPPTTGLQRTAAVAKSVAGTIADPTFIGAIGFQSLAMGAYNGEFRQSAKDFGTSLISPDFYAGVGMFNLTFSGGGALVDKLGAGVVSTALGEKVASKAVPLLGETVGAVARENIVLGMALTVPKLVSMDLGGFTFKDAVHLDFRKLKAAPILTFAQLWTHDSSKGLFGGYHMAPGVGSMAEDVGMTLASFVVAGAVLKPVMTRIGAQLAKLGLREALAFAGERLAARVVAAGAVEAGALFVPGAGEIVDGVLLVGNVLWAAVDVISFVVAPRAVALGTTMLAANALQKPVQSWNDQRQADDYTRDAVKKLMDVAAQNGGVPDPAALKDALAGTMAAFRDERGLAYLPAAIDDVTFASRVDRVGDGDYEAAMRAKNEKINSGAMDAYGQDLFQLARTVAYKRSYDALQPANASDTEAAGIYADYRTKVMKDVAAVYASPTIPDAALDPSSPSFEISHNPTQLYDQEAAVYARVKSMVTDPAAQKTLADNVALLGVVKTVDTKIMKEATGQIPSPAPKPAAPVAAPVAPEAQPPRTGITGALEKTNGD